MVTKVFALPFPFSHPGGIRNLFKIHKTIKEIERQNDLLIIQLPIIGFPAFLTLKKPVVFHLCANVRTAATNPLKYKGFNGLAARAFAGVVHAVHRMLFNRRNVKVLTNGNELACLYSKFKPIRVLSTSLSKNDIIGDDALFRTRNGEVLHILFVGRPSLEKGFHILVKSLMRINRGFRLTVIGFTLEEFQLMLPGIFDESADLHSDMCFKGYLNWGDDFKEIMREQDLLIVPSTSEGTPRVILEAMSQGIAVIGSRTGGIPDIIEEGETGLLFDVGDVEGLSSKINILARDEHLRKKIVKGGLELARKNTVEHFASYFIESIEKLNK